MTTPDHALYLVRHGEAAARWGEDPDPGLSELGQAQARRTQISLIDELTGPVSIITSPLRRARETAAPLAEALGAQVRIDDAFKEIPAPVPLAQRHDWLAQFMRGAWSGQPPSLLAWRAGLIERLVNIDHSAVIFTHFMVLNAVVGALDDRPETVCFRPANASITRLRRDASGLHLVALGDEMKTVVN